METCADQGYVPCVSPPATPVVQVIPPLPSLPDSGATFDPTFFFFGVALVVAGLTTYAVDKIKKGPRT